MLRLLIVGLGCRSFQAGGRIRRPKHRRIIPRSKECGSFVSLQFSKVGFPNSLACRLPKDACLRVTTYRQMFTLSPRRTAPAGGAARYRRGVKQDMPKGWENPAPVLAEDAEAWVYTNLLVDEKEGTSAGPNARDTRLQVNAGV